LAYTGFMRTDVFFTNKKGFTLIELLVVIAIIGILASVILAIIGGVRDEARLAKSRQDLRSMRNALELYANRYGVFPDDVSRGVPNNIEQYIEGGEWPKPAWENALYDWDKWNISGEEVIQLSVRFCDEYGNNDEHCNFPSESWAENFDYYSAVYLCIQGGCRSHRSKPLDHPGYCINCGNNE